MKYIELICRVVPDKDYRHILISMLFDIGYESFVEEEETFSAFIPADLFSEKDVIDIKVKLSENKVHFDYQYLEHQEKNWNEEWEKHFEPVFVEEKLVIRAPFHPSFLEKYRYEIIIAPMMAFGTGHHETTYLMLKNMLNTEFKEKNVLDVGCGTGILGILSSLLGATNIVCIDNDKWAYENSLHNIKLNNVSNVEILHGEIESLKGNMKFDIILANINLNTIIKLMNDFSSLISENGILFLSGFFDTDIEFIKETSKKYNFVEQYHEEKNNWALLKLKKT